MTTLDLRVIARVVKDVREQVKADVERWVAWETDKSRAAQASRAVGADVEYAERLVARLALEGFHIVRQEEERHGHPSA